MKKTILIFVLALVVAFGVIIGCKKNSSPITPVATNVPTPVATNVPTPASGSVLPPALSKSFGFGNPAGHGEGTSWNSIVTSSDSSPIPEQFSIACFYKWDANNTGIGDAYLIAKSSASGNDFRLAADVAWYFNRSFDGNTAYFYWRPEDMPTADGKWHALVLTYDHASPNTSVPSLYVDGVLLPIDYTSTSTTRPGASDTPQNTAGRVWTLGNTLWTTQQEGSLAGRLTQVGIFSRILSPTEIAQHAQWYTPNSFPSLVDYFPLIDSLDASCTTNDTVAGLQ
jgi:hypothetical protein